MMRQMVLVWVVSTLSVSAAQPSFDELLHDIQTGNVYQRQRAVSRMVGTGDSRVAGTLAGLLKNDDAGIRTGAAQELVKLADPMTADALAEALSDENDRVRQYVAEGLQRIGSDRHVPALVVSITSHLPGSADASSLVALTMAVEAVGQPSNVAPPEFLALMNNISRGDEFEVSAWWRVEAEIARSLGQIGDRQALDALRQAREVLETKHQDYRTWYAICKAMASIDPNGAPFDRPAADIFDSIEQSKGGIYGEQPLTELGKEAMADLEWVLQFDRPADWDRAHVALSVLGAIGSPRAADVLRHYVSDRLASAQDGLPSGIGSLCVSALGHLLKVVPTEATAREVFAFAHQLDDSDQQSLLSNVIGASSTSVPNEIRLAFLKWAVLGTDQAEPLSRDARISTAGILGRIGGQDSGRILSEVLQRLTNQAMETTISHQEIRLGKTGSDGKRSVIPPRSVDDSEAVAIIEALRRIKDYDAVPMLIAAAQLPNVPKDAIAHALGDISDARAVPVLRELARRSDLDDSARLWTAAALARLDVDYEEHARVIRDALPNSLRQARWLSDRETVTAVASLVAVDTEPAERVSVSYARSRSRYENVVSVLQSIGTEDALEAVAGLIDLEDIDDMDRVRKLSSTAAQIANRLGHEDQKRWESVTSIATAVRDLVSGMYLVSYEQRIARPRGGGRTLEKQLEVIDRDPALARRMWIAEVNGLLDGTSILSRSWSVSVGAVHLAREVYTPELVPLLERIVIESKEEAGFPSERSSSRYYKARSMAAQLLTEKTGRRYTFVDVDGQTHPGGWDPSQGQ